MKLPSLARRRYLALLLRLAGNGAAQAVAAIGVAMLVREAFGRIGTVAGTPASLLPLAGMLLAVTGGAIALRIFERRDGARLAETYVTQIRLRLFDALVDSAEAAPRARALGPTLLRFVTDLTAIRQWVSNGLARLIVSCLALPGGLIALAIIDPVISGAVTGLAALGIAVGLFGGRPLESRVRLVRGQRAKLAARVGDRLRAIGVIRVFGQYRRERKNLARLSQRLASASVSRAALSAAIRIIPDAVLGLATLTILGLGAFRVQQGMLDHGAVIAALSVLGTMAPAARGLGRVYDYRINYRVAADKLKQILSGRQRAKILAQISAVPAVAERLTLRDLTIPGALLNINANVEPGQVIAITGPSGSGKSALLAAIAGIFDVGVGRCVLGNCDLPYLDGRDRADLIGIAAANLPLVKGSIRHNLRYRVPNASDDAIAEAVSLCGLEDDLAKLPGGLDTRLTETAGGLPSGLQRRLMLARAIMGGPRVLLLDEMDAGAEPGTRQAIDRILARHDGIVLFATQDVDRAMSADRLWFLDAGQLIEDGPPAVLLAAGGSSAAHFRLEAKCDLVNITRLPDRHRA